MLQPECKIPTLVRLGELGETRRNWVHQFSILNSQFSILKQQMTILNSQHNSQLLPQLIEPEQ
ncbi:MAG: hypothetical protein F6K31_11235 [Symploca sp. SIO2G7]|nr:hypothetical protein [Symploca sp. SIO2G7]